MKTLNHPTPEGIELGSHLARFADAEVPKLLAKFPGTRERCATCAFRKGTLPNGCPATLMDALKCVHERTATFMCHEHEGEPCIGAAALTLNSEMPAVKIPWNYSDEPEGE